jgi:hypothetical protein
MTTITIDSIEYPLDTLSEDAKNQLASVQFVDQKLAQLEAEVAVYKTARSGYCKALQEALPAAKNNKSKR